MDKHIYTKWEDLPEVRVVDGAEAIIGTGRVTSVYKARDRYYNTLIWTCTVRFNPPLQAVVEYPLEPDGVRKFEEILFDLTSGNMRVWVDGQYFTGQFIRIYIGDLDRVRALSPLLYDPTIKPTLWQRIKSVFSAIFVDRSAP